MGPFKEYVIVKIPIFEPPPPCHRLSPFALSPVPPCHHPNSDKLFDPKLSKESLGLCLIEHIRMPKRHRQAELTRKQYFMYVFKTSDTVVSKSEKFQITVY